MTVALDRYLSYVFGAAPEALLSQALLLFLLSHLIIRIGSKRKTMPSSFVSLRAGDNSSRDEYGAASPASPARSFASLAIGNNANSYSNGYSNGHSHSQSNGHSNGYAKHQSNGHSNGHVNVKSDSDVNGFSRASHDDEFLRLPAPQQDILLLHGPRQKYSLERARDIPELRGDREILVQVLAIGLNPVDWKGADYGFGQPSYPWINGRDFAGIVVRAPRKQSRVQQGDVVFGASTDYRDVRKAAYQEYVVTTDYNVTRIPQGVSVKEGAALGVAYVAAIVSLGISFGLNFAQPRNGAPAGPDLLRLVRELEPRNIPEDVREEIFSGITTSERPHAGEFIAIWGANSMTGQIALQLSKLAGLRVIAIADIAKGGGRLTELGADFLVDKYDTKRAVEIIRTVSGGKLRFGFDANGADSAALLSEALQKNTSGPKSHLLGLGGLPKQAAAGVVHHKVPIKIFHEDASAGEAISQWLEDLLIARSLKLPEVEIAEGGLSGINDALDRLRSGKIGGRRIVVPVNKESGSQSPVPQNGKDVPNTFGVPISASDFSYADSLNSDPDRVKFAYWVPNVSGGLVISKIEQRTHWDHKSNIKYGRIAERSGFEYALSQIRFMAGYGADNQHEPVSLSQAILAGTERLKLIIALLPGPWNPAIAAKQIASIDVYSEGRTAVNIVSGWFKLEVRYFLYLRVSSLLTSSFSSQALVSGG
jgi:NADPH:quinone reductase-like Zn-dependent oxidoreductase